MHYCQVQHRGERLLFRVFHVKRCPGILTYILPGECISVEKHNNSGWGTGSEWGSHISSANGQEGKPTCCSPSTRFISHSHVLSDNLHVCQVIVVLRQRKDVMPCWKEYKFLLQRTAVKSSNQLCCSFVRFLVWGAHCRMMATCPSCPQTLLTDDGAQQIWLECTTVTLAL